MTVAAESTSCFRHGHESHAEILFLRLTWLCSPLARQDLDVQTISNDAYIFAQVNSHTSNKKTQTHVLHNLRLSLQLLSSCHGEVLLFFHLFSVSTGSLC